MSEVEPVLQIVSSLGVAAVLAWYLYYTTTVSFPKMNDHTLDRIDAIQNKHTTTIENVCKDFTQTIREERMTRREEINMLRDELRARNCTGDTVDRQEPTS